MKSVRTALTAAGPKTRHTLAPDLIKLKTSATMAAELVEHSKIDAKQGAQPMPIETNREIVRAIFDELARGNGKPFSDAMADDFQWTIKGTTAWSKTYRGKQTVRKELLSPLFGQFTGTYINRARRILCDGDVVVIEYEGNVMTKSGKPYCNSYCYVVEMADGKFQSLTEYLDTALVEGALEPPQ